MKCKHDNKELESIADGIEIYQCNACGNSIMVV